MNKFEQTKKLIQEGKLQEALVELKNLQSLDKSDLDVIFNLSYVNNELCKETGNDLYSIEAKSLLVYFYNNITDQKISQMITSDDYYHVQNMKKLCDMDKNFKERFKSIKNKFSNEFYNSLSDGELLELIDSGSKFHIKKMKKCAKDIPAFKLKIISLK
jgi:hypothetical protein